MKVWQARLDAVVDVPALWVRRNDKSMLPTLAVAGFIAFVSGLALRVGAFVTFALIAGALYFGLLLYRDHGLLAALGLVLLLLVVMQVFYVLGALLPSLFSRTMSRRRQLSHGQRHPEPQESRSPSNTRPL